jgi:hypothetical protein
MQQFIICQNSIPQYALALGTSEETANKVLADVVASIPDNLQTNYDLRKIRILELLDDNKPQIKIEKYTKDGRFYGFNKIDLLTSEISEDGNIAFMSPDISDRVKQLESEHLKQGGFVRITVEDIGYPCLIHNLRK